jgi:replicative DNA helicase
MADPQPSFTISPKSETTGDRSRSLISFLPPHDSDVEKAFLGLILLNKKLMDDVADILKPDFFYLPEHQLIFHIMLDLWAGNRPIDVLVMTKEVLTHPQQPKLDAENSITQEFLLELTARASLASSIEDLANQIKNHYLLRTVIGAADEMKALATHPEQNAQDILDEAQQKLYNISLQSVDKTFVSIREVLGDTFERISELHNNKDQFRGVPTGFTDLDKILGGFHKSDLIILAARPSMGKTSLCLEFCKRVALLQQVGVAIFSLEMGKDQLVDRLVSSTSGIELHKIRGSQSLSTDSNNNEFVKLGEAIGQLDQAPIWIDDSGGLNVMELRSKARRLKARHNIGLLIIDYLQLMSAGSSSKYSGNRVQEVSEISRGLKMLARELNVPILALSQLSRSVESRDDKRPMLSDLRDSGSIEQDADVVMFIHREEMYHRETKKRGIADILISKHRNGQTGSIELAWIHHLASFENLDGARIRRRVNE